MKPKAILAGGSGFLGRALAQKLAAGGWEVVILTRNPEICHILYDKDAAVRAVGWNGETGGAWEKELEGATALVNFTGRSINCVHTPENSREILESRVNAVRALGKAVAQTRQPPAVWVQCSGSGYYGNGGDTVCEESSPAGCGRLAEVCRRWEEEFNRLELPGTRRVILRLGVVLGREAGALPPLVRLVRWYLGGAAGNGRQYFSWIHREDLLEIFLAALEQLEFSGVYNACAPEPVTNGELMRGLRTALGRPWCPPAPGFLVRFAARYWLKTEASLILHGQRAIPARLIAADFPYKYGRLNSALADLVDRTKPNPTHSTSGAE